MMKKSKLVIIIGLALVLALGSVLHVSAGGQRDTEFRPKDEYTMQVNVGPAFDWGIGAQKWADLVRERTNGEINIEPYFGSTLLAGRQTNWFQAVSDGSIDFVVESTINASPVIRALNLFNLPFFFDDYEAVDKVLEGKAGQKIIEEIERGGVKFLAWGENGFRQLTNSERPVRTPQDVAGLRVRVVGSPLFVDIFRSLGADPINMNWGDAVTAFQQGVVDGQENPKSVLTVVQIWDYHQYMTNWNYVLDPLIFGLNMRVWESLPPNIQQIVKESAIEAAEYQKALARAYLDGDKSLNILRDKFNMTEMPLDPFKLADENDMTIIDLTPAQMQAFRDATMHIYDDWVPRIGQELYDLAVADMQN